MLSALKTSKSGQRPVRSLPARRVAADSARRFEEEAWSILDSHADKAWSYIDATSFALIDREETTFAFAFDRHFGQRGLTLLP